MKKFIPKTPHLFSLIIASLLLVGLSLYDHAAYAAASLVSSGTAVSVTSGNLTSIGVPAGIANNDILVVVMHSRDNVVSTMPADWTLKVAGNGNTTNRLSVWWKRTTGTESAPTITHTGGNAAIASMHAFRGLITTGDPFDTVGAVQSNAGSPISTSAITTSTAGDMILHAFGSQDYNGWSTFTGIPTTVAGSISSINNPGSNDNSLGLTYGLQGSAGGTGAAGATQSSRGPDAGVSVQLALKPAPPSTTTIGDGANPSNVSLIPGGSITDLDTFTFVASAGTDSITGLTVTLTGTNSYQGLSEVRITSNAGGTTYFSPVTDPTSNTIAFSGGTAIPVTTSATSFKIRITPKSHANMPLPPGATYTVGGTVTAFTSTNSQLGSDSGSASISIDNLSPASATALSGSAGSTQVTLNWTTSASADLSRTVVLRWASASAGTEVPAEGVDYTTGNTIGAATVACIRTIDAPSTPISATDGAGLGGCSATPLTNGQAYTYKIFQKDSNGNYDAGATIGTFTPTPAPTTTLGTGSDPIATTIAPGAGATDVDTFTLQTNTGSEAITSVTVNLSTSNGVGTLAITDNANTVLGSTASPVTGSNTITVSGMSAGTGGSAFKVRVTPLAHTAMPAVPGGSYAITAPVTSWAGSYVHTGSDTNTTALTIDNASPSSPSGATGTAGNAQVTLNWTNPADADYHSTIALRRATTAVGDTPVEGITYIAGNTIGSSVVACVITAPTETCLDSGLTNGTPYYYKLFAKDSNGNYSTGVTPTGAPFSPSATTYNISSSAGAGGTIDPLGNTSVAEGGSQTYTITPDAGYNIATLVVDGSGIATSTSYTFSNVHASHTISATFVAIPVTFTITASAGANGAVDPTGITTVLQGGSQSYTITPNSGYEIETLVIDGSSIATSTSYAFTNVQANHTISATFVALPLPPNTFTITATAGVGGTVSPLGTSVVTQGNSQGYTITPDAGYNIESMTVDGSPVATSTSYTFTDVQSNHTIDATFVAIPLTFTITASTGGNGTVLPDGVTSVTQGNSQSYTINPDPGYQINTLYIDGTPVTGASTYTFSNVQANHTISATFSALPVTYTIYSSTGPNGTIAPLGATVVAQGGSQSFTITPDAGYNIATLRVDSLLIATSSTYAFTNVQSTHSIETTFSANSVTPPPPPPPATPYIPSGSGAQAVKVTFSGFAFPGGRVYIIDKEVKSEALAGKEVVPGASGAFDITFSGVIQGIHSFGLLIKDKDKRIAQTKYFLIDNTEEKQVIKNIIVPPTIDIINGQVTRGKITTVFGYATPGNTLRIHIDGTLIGEVDVNTNGTYRYDIATGALDFGQHSVQTQQYNKATGQSSDLSTLRTFIVSRLTVVKADFNGDSKIDIKDWSIFLFRWGAKGSVGRESIDLNGDGKIDISDFSIFIKTIKK